ncbi:MAG: hypothetical protein HN509_11140 [Halobacteriovoraceae bacterium]|jgi:glycosyltransferase involved in cell wall biosynthesis|nr:hypothetical protein [Halobacteriovoraceae bacterium]MBT5092852.1 hypothetical protein [Halobacteriovoraceae bacterium]
MTKISGFTFIKNGLSLGYPIAESVQSIEPLCDQIVINVGFDNPELTGDDGTWEYLNDTFQGSKYLFLKSFWDPELTSRGLILSDQTNIALQKCTGDFCQYIQGDEVIHQDDLAHIEDSLKVMVDDQNIHGLLFNYLHFYGNVDIIKHTRSSYRREVRLIRNGLGIKSWLDAQGFRHSNNTKINCIQGKPRIFHYGWARQQQVMTQKVKSFDKLYHGNQYDSEDFSYQKIWGLKKFHDSHPQVMQAWIEKNQNQLDVLNLPLRFEWRNFGLAFSDFVEKYTDYRIGEYKNYKLVKAKI